MFFISPFESTVSHKNQVSCWVFFLGERNSVKVARKSKKRQPGLLILDSGKTRKNRSGRKHFSLAKKYIFCQHFLFFYSLEIFSGSCLFFPLFSQQESIKNHPKRGWDWQFPRRQEPKRAFLYVRPEQEAEESQQEMWAVRVSASFASRQIWLKNWITRLENQSNLSLSPFFFREVI